MTASIRYWATFLSPRFSAASAALMEAVRSQGFETKTSSQRSSTSPHFCRDLAVAILHPERLELQPDHPTRPSRDRCRTSDAGRPGATGDRPDYRARACTPPCTSGPRRRRCLFARRRCRIRSRPSPCPRYSDPTPRPSSRSLPNRGERPGMTRSRFVARGDPLDAARIPRVSLPWTDRSRLAEWDAASIITPDQAAVPLPELRRGSTEPTFRNYFCEKWGKGPSGR